MKKILAMILIFMLCGSAFAAEPEAISRGGTIVVRIPWEWINRAELGPSWWGSIDHAVGDTLEQVLFPVVPPGKVAEWKLQGSVAEERIRSFNISSIDSKALVMNRRPLDDHYYAVIRPESKFSGSFNLHYSISEWGMSIQDQIAHGDLRLDMETKVLPLKIKSMDKAKPAWKGSFEGFEISLFKADSVYVAVITEDRVQNDDLRYTQLYIDAPGYDFDYFYTRMEGYMDDGEGVYCCVISEGEALLMMEGAKVRLEHDHSKW